MQKQLEEKESECAYFPALLVNTDEQTEFLVSRGETLETPVGEGLDTNEEATSSNTMGRETKLSETSLREEVLRLKHQLSEVRHMLTKTKQQRDLFFQERGTFKHWLMKAQEVQVQFQEAVWENVPESHAFINSTLAPPREDSAETGQIINGRWKLEQVIGRGGRGTVSEARDIYTGHNVTVKIENVEDPERGPSAIERERIVYDHFHSQQSSGFINRSFLPNVFAYGKYKERSWMAMSRLGPSVRDHWKALHRRFTLSCALTVGIRALPLLEQLHDAGFVHEDVKPHNLLTDPEFPGRLRLIDFGLTKYCENWELTPREQRSGLYGTPEYASISAHAGQPPSRADDLESLGYVIVELFRGELPWSSDAGHSRARWDEIYQEKVYPSSRNFLSDDVPALQEYFNVVESLRFTDRPDYAELSNILRKGLAEEGEKIDWLC